MKQYVEVIKDSFTDFAGKEHLFIIAAVSSLYDESDQKTVVARVSGFIAENVAQVVKDIRIGVSICNPTDEFNEKVGILKATGRAKSSAPVLAVTEGGFVSVPVIRALLSEQAKYIKENPGDYIKGYNESKEKYMKKVEMEKVEENFTEDEKKIIAKVEQDPRYLDNVQKYLDWISCKRKCKKTAD